MSLFKSLASALVAALTMCALPAMAQNKITLGEVGTGSAAEWPLYIAMAKEFTGQEKISLDIVGVPSSAGVMQQIAAGSLDLGTSGMADAVRAVDHGAPTRILRVGEGPSPYQVFALPSIKSWADLRNKTVMIGGAQDITRIYFEDMAKPNGLTPGTYSYIYAGAAYARFAALASGSVAATILPPPFSFKAASEGYTNLGTSADYTKNFPFTGYSVNVNWAKTHPAAVCGFLAAYTKAVDWFYDPKNRNEAISILVNRLKANPKDAAEGYDFFVKGRMFDRKGAVESSGLENLIAILKRQGGIEGGTELSRFYDPSLVCSAAK